MTEQKRIAISPVYLEESPLYSFSSRAGSPTAQLKLLNVPFEFTENTRPGSFVSYQTPLSHFSSISNMHDPNLKLSDESLIEIHQKIQKIKEEYDLKSSERPLQLEIPEKYSENLDLGIPTLCWCPFCKCETATEVFYENSPKTFWSSLAIFLSGGVFGCFMLPYMMDSCKNARSRCHRCKHNVDYSKL